MQPVRYKKLCFTLCLLSAATLSAQEVMTLERCRERALEHNRHLSIAERSIEKAGYTQKVYRANYFPKFSAYGNYLYTNGKLERTIPESYLPTFVPDPATGEMKPNLLGTLPDGSPLFKEYAYMPEMDLLLKVSNVWMAGVSAQQPLFMGGKITSAYRMSRIGTEVAHLNRTLTRSQVIVATDEAYWQHVLACESHKVALSYREVVTELLRNVQDAVEVGLKHRNDLLKVQAKANEAELQVTQAENAVRLSRKNLCHLLVLPLDTELILPEAFEDSHPYLPDYTGDLSRRPEYAMLQKQIELKEQEIKLTRSEFLPQAGVSVNYGYMNGLQFNGSTLIDKASFSVMATLSVPLFQWGEGRNKIRAAKAEKQIARIQQEEMQEKMSLELERAYDKCRESELEVAMASKLEEQAHESMQVSHDMYQAGMETLADYMETQTVWLQACLKHINTQTTRRLHHTYYRKAAGELE